MPALAEHREQLLEILGVGGEVRGQQIVDFVVEEVALLLADDDQLPDFIKLFFERDGHIRISPRRCRALHCNSFGGFIASKARIMRCFLVEQRHDRGAAISLILQAVELPLDFGQLTFEPDIFEGHHAQIRKHGRGRRLGRDRGQEFRLLST